MLNRSLRSVFFGLCAAVLLTAGGAWAKAPSKGRILVVLSSASALEVSNGKSHPTGFWLNELMVPAKALVDAGYTLVLANPAGKPPSVDPHSDKASFFRDEAEYKALKAMMAKLLPGTRRLDAVVAEGLDGYAGVFVPGGHAPMQDLASDPLVGKVLRHFHTAKKPTALLCHGPAALLAALDTPDAFFAAASAGQYAAAAKAGGTWIYAGYRISAFSQAEEDVVEGSGRFSAPVRWDLEPALRSVGAKFEINGKNFASHAVRDRELITGQNPSSDGALVKLFLAALAEGAR